MESVEYLKFNKNRYFILFTFFITLTSSSVYASLIERDWLTTGDGLLTYDTTTNLEYLDLSLTLSMSYNTVNSQLGSGSAFDGFRFATSYEPGSDFRSLLSSADVRYVGSVYELAEDGEVDRLSNLLNLLGVTNHNSLDVLTDYYWNDAYPWSTHSALCLYYNTTLYPYDVIITGGFDFNPNDDFSTPRMASLLVRNAAQVPEPATMLLLGTGMVGLIGSRIRCKKS